MKSIKMVAPVAPNILRAAAVLLGTLILLWPALYNGFPLLYPDSMTYLADGALVARAVFLQHFSTYYGVRSLVYSLTIFPFHWNLNAWPVAMLQAAAVAWVLWTLVRIFSPRRAVPAYLILLCTLSLVSGLAWYSSFLMPDVLGPVAYLSIFLLVYGGDALSHRQRTALCALAWWGITAHATHLLLAAGLCLLLGLFALWERTRRRLRGLALAMATLLLAAASQVALNAYLFHQLSLNGERPPYLLARVIADGPGKLYLDRHCATEHWAVCASLAQLGDDPDAFLWEADGAYESRSEEEQAQIRQEEMPLVKAIVRAYPRQQGERSWANFRDQLFAFGIYGFDDSPWLRAQFDTTLQPARAAWLRSRQANSQLPLDALTALQGWSVVISLGVIVLTSALFRLRLGARLAALTGAVLALVLANAALTGILSMVDDRYGCRVIWMIPLVAGLCLIEAIGRLRAVREAKGLSTGWSTMGFGRRIHGKATQSTATLPVLLQPASAARPPFLLRPSDAEIPTEMPLHQSGTTS